MMVSMRANMSRFIVSKIRKFFFTIFNLPSWRVERGGADEATAGAATPAASAQKEAQHGGATLRTTQWLTSILN